MTLLHQPDPIHPDMSYGRQALILTMNNLKTWWNGLVLTLLIVSSLAVVSFVAALTIHCWQQP